eukprot:1766471-Heterocapsa_arctica.AAC.1
MSAWRLEAGPAARSQAQSSSTGSVVAARRCTRGIAAAPTGRVARRAGMLAGGLKRPPCARSASSGGAGLAGGGDATGCSCAA